MYHMSKQDRHSLYPHGATNLVGEIDKDIDNYNIM